ncbi:MAG TPA: 3-dehydroquinate synthase [Paludibacteraceae bacterium]|nr:3-dehydroquinate synthase [Paludibacteraceae bacterium]
MLQGSTIICNDFVSELSEAIGNQASESIFILVDENTQRLCLPTVMKINKLQNSHIVSIPAGDEHKNIDTAIQIWQYLSEHGATRQSLMINVGGGMVTDIGGFTAATFKRGIRYLNIPTTLLGAVDAATGGKTGINFLGLKNEIGVFAPAKKVLINVDFFKTLDDKNFRSGFAEMVKHALLDSRKEWNDILTIDLDNIDFDFLKQKVEKSVHIKEAIVEKDPKEQNLRKALNLGHTFGHAFESFSLLSNKPLLHGYAVMWGLLCELYLSVIKFNFPQEDLLRLKYLIKEHYGTFSISCENYEKIYELMSHDKKNRSKEINFTLLSDIGQVQLNQTASKEEIFECLDFLNNGL